MTESPQEPPSVKRESTLRERAEATMRRSPTDIGRLSAAETQKLIHELQVHHIELEMQNAELRRIQEELVQSRDRFRHLYDSTPIGYMTLGPNATVQEANLTLASMLGVDRQALTGLRFTRFVAPGSQDTLYLHQRHAFGSDTKCTCELVLRRADAMEFVVMLETASVQDPVTGTASLRCSLIDITDRKKVEEAQQQLNETLEQRVAERTAALRESEGRFRAFTEATNDVVYRMSPDWTEMSFLQGRRFIPDMLQPSRTWLDKYIHPDDQPSVMETIQGAIQSKSVFELEHRVIRVNGSLGWVYSRAIPILNDRGEIVEWFGTASDVTQRKQAELDLSVAKSRLEAALAAMTDAVFISDRDGCCIYFNEAFATFHRFRNHEECAKALHEFPAFLDVLLPDGEPAALDQWAVPRALRGETAHNVEYELRRKDTGECWIGSYNFAPIRDSEGKIMGTVVVGRDVTEERGVSSALILRDTQLQDLTVRLLTAQDDERRRIARDLHDDYMQRLAALALDLHHLSRSLAKSGEEAQAAITQFARTTEQLTTDLQQFAHQLHPSLLNHAGLEPTLRDHVEEFERRTGLKTEVQVRDFPSTLPDQYAVCLYRVLQECLQNVRKHAKASFVLVRLLGTRRGVGLCVRDDGHGFDFVQGAPKEQKGLGLISLGERLEALNGTFRIKTKPGGGTEIHAWIPLEREEALEKIEVGI